MRRRILLQLNTINISAAVVTVENQTYNGSALTPTPSVTLNGNIIPSDGYTVTYSNNINAGTATITIVGDGITYRGTVTQTFTIAKASINPSVNLNSWVEGETAQDPSVSGNTGNGSISYRYKLLGEDDSTYTTTKPTIAGEYTIEASIAQTSNTLGAVVTTNFIITVANNIIKYHASEQLTETTDGKSSGFHYDKCIDINGNTLTMTSHTFNDGIGTIQFSGDIDKVATAAFCNCGGLTKVILPQSVTRVGSQTIYDSDNILNIYVSRYMTDLTSGTSDGLFYSACNGISQVIVDENNPIYDSRDNCNAIIITATNTLGKGCKNTIIPQSVTSIGTAAFVDGNCPLNVVIPSSIVSIGAKAFAGCTSTQSIRCEAITPPQIDSTTFDNIGDCQIQVPSTSLADYQSAWSSVSDRIVGY